MSGQFAAALALTTALDEDEDLRQAVYALVTDKSAAKAILAHLLEHWPDEFEEQPKAKKKRKRRAKAEAGAGAPSPAPPTKEPNPEDELGSSAVAEYLGMSLSWFNLQIKDEKSPLRMVAYKVGSRWKVKRRDVVTLAKAKAAKAKLKGGSVDANGRAWPAASVGL